MGGSPEVSSSRPAWPTWRNPISTKNTKISWAWWHVPIISATQEVEAGELLEPGRWSLQSAKIVPLHSSLGDIMRLYLKKKKNEGTMLSVCKPPAGLHLPSPSSVPWDSDQTTLPGPTAIWLPVQLGSPNGKHLQELRGRTEAGVRLFPTSLLCALCCIFCLWLCPPLRDLLLCGLAMAPAALFAPVAFRLTGCFPLWLASECPNIPCRSPE